MGDKPEAFYGMAVAGFPNLFMINGPNTGLGHNSMIYMAECGGEPEVYWGNVIIGCLHAVCTQFKVDEGRSDQAAQTFCWVIRKMSKHTGITSNTSSNFCIVPSRCLLHCQLCNRLHHTAVVPLKLSGCSLGRAIETNHQHPHALALFHMLVAVIFKSQLLHCFSWQHAAQVRPSHPSLNNTIGMPM
jgi:hypothetical protein